MKLTRQQKQVLRMLSRGPVKNWEFAVNFICNYTARISELRQKGFDIPPPKRRNGTSLYILLGSDQLTLNLGDTGLSTMQEKILNYLEARNDWASPSEIALHIADSSASWASPKCCRLVAIGYLERNEHGHYRVKGGNDDSKKQVHGRGNR